jgi:enoyl-CoA hydratase/carnithine racemase
VPVNPTTSARCGVFETVRYEKRDRIAFVTLDRPEVRNAIDPAMHDELCRVWQQFRDDEDLDVAILSGAGGSVEAWNSYTCVDREEATALLQQFYDRTDPGRPSG